LLHEALSGGGFNEAKKETNMANGLAELLSELQNDCTVSGKGETAMKIVGRPDNKVVIQFREFKRPKDGGNMELSESKTLTLHDVSLEDVYPQIQRLFGPERASAAPGKKKR
jgi:hypothetical protein